RRTDRGDQRPPRTATRHRPGLPPPHHVPRQQPARDRLLQAPATPATATSPPLGRAAKRPPPAPAARRRPAAGDCPLVAPRQAPHARGPERHRSQPASTSGVDTNHSTPVLPHMTTPANIIVSQPSVLRQF